MSVTKRVMLSYRFASQADEGQWRPMSVTECTTFTDNINGFSELSLIRSIKRASKTL
jgi:hypothetical protein